MILHNFFVLPRYKSKTKLLPFSLLHFIKRSKPHSIRATKSSIVEQNINAYIFSCYFFMCDYQEFTTTSYTSTVYMYIYTYINISNIYRYKPNSFIVVRSDPHVSLSPVYDRRPASIAYTSYQLSYTFI